MNGQDHREQSHKGLIVINQFRKCIRARSDEAPRGKNSYDKGQYESTSRKNHGRDDDRKVVKAHRIKDGGKSKSSWLSEIVVSIGNLKHHHEFTMKMTENI